MSHRVWILDSPKTLNRNPTVQLSNSPIQQKTRVFLVLTHFNQLFSHTCNMQTSESAFLWLLRYQLGEKHLCQRVMGFKGIRDNGSEIKMPQQKPSKQISSGKFPYLSLNLVHTQWVYMMRLTGS